MSRQIDKSTIIFRFKIVAWVAVAIGVLIIGRVIYIGTVKHDYWMKVAAQKKVENEPILPERGNILSCDGRMLSGTLPEYVVNIDLNLCRQLLD